MAYTVHNFDKINNDNDLNHLKDKLNLMQKLQEAYKDNPHRKYQYSIEEKLLNKQIEQFNK